MYKDYSSEEIITEANRMQAEKEQLNQENWISAFKLEKEKG